MLDSGWQRCACDNNDDARVTLYLSKIKKRVNVMTSISYMGKVRKEWMNCYLWYTCK